MPSYALTLENVEVRFGTDVIFRSVNLNIKPAECLVLIGPSGQGKSVALKLLAGLLKPNSGRVLIEGEVINGISDAARAQKILKMGMLFQKNALFDSLTVGENIAFPLRETTTLTEEEIQTRVKDFLEAVGLSHAKDLFPDEISGGMQKRVGIARALALNPKIIFYDDPTAGLDPITSRKIIELIVELKQKNGTTVVAVTNDMARAYQMADTIALVVDGEIVVAGDRDATINNKDPRIHSFIRGEDHGQIQ